MRPIHPLLLAGAAIAPVVHLRYLRSSIRDRMSVVLLLVTLMIAVPVPDLTQQTAHLLGVGRGAGLTPYVVILVAVFAGLLLDAKVARLHRALTVLVPRLALQQALEVASRETIADQARNA